MEAPRDDRPTPPRRPSADDAPDAASSRRRAGSLEACGAWLGRFPPGSPVYALPRPLVAALARPMRIDAADVRAERLLEDFCRRCGAVGVRDGLPLLHRWLAPGSPEPARGRSIAERNRAAATRGPGSPLDDADLRLKGYLGRLLTHPDFLREFAGRREAWSALPDSGRPPLPLRREDLAAPGAADRGFAASFVAFCDRWALAGAAAWDLPEPQAPVVGLPSSPRPPGVLVALPFHLDLEADRDLLRRIRRAQEEQALAVGLGAAAGGLANYAAFARVLEVLHWERVATGRYLAPGRRSAGFVEPLVRGIARSLGLKVSQVEKVRKTISALRKGRDPSSIAALRTRS